MFKFPSHSQETHTHGKGIVLPAVVLVHLLLSTQFILDSGLCAEDRHILLSEIEKVLTFREEDRHVTK